MKLSARCWIALIFGLAFSGAVPASAEKIIFAYPSPSTSFLPLVVAQKKGFFEPENLQPELVQIRPAVAVPGLTIGSVDFTTVLGSTIAARMRGVPLVITGVFADKPMDFWSDRRELFPRRSSRTKSSASAPSAPPRIF